MNIARVCLLGALLAVSTQATEKITRETSGVKTVLVLGDSLSEGFRLNPRDAWPSLVAQRLRAIDPKFVLVNASVSGSTWAIVCNPADGLVQGSDW